VEIHTEQKRLADRVLGVKVPKVEKGRDAATPVKKGRVRKEDIGPPHNVKHIAHVGWDTQEGLIATGDSQDETVRVMQCSLPNCSQRLG
jgi:P21-Rho-binding domain